MKLTLEQKTYLKSLDSDKKRKKQKKAFKKENSIGEYDWSAICSFWKKRDVNEFNGVLGKMHYSTDNGKKINSTLTKDMLEEITKPLMYAGTTRFYTLEEMRECFAESRLTHSIIGFKHDSFASYLNSLEK